MIWEFSPPKSGFEGTPIVVDNRVFVADVEGRVFAIRLDDGKPIWDVKFKNGFVVAAAFQDERLLIGDFDGHIYCLNAADGSVVWETELAQAVAAGANFFGSNALISSESGLMYSFDLKSGTKNWEFSTGDQLRSAPTVWNKFALLGGCDGRLHRIDVAKGEADSDGLPLDGPTGSTPAVIGTTAVVPTQSGQVLAFNLETNERLWLFEDRERSQEIRSSPAIGRVEGETPIQLAVVTTRNRRVLAIDLSDGQMEWEALIKKRSDASPVICDGRVWVGATDGMLYALDLRTGKETWSYQMSGQFVASPAIASDRLIVATDKGTVACFGIKN